MEAHQTSDGVRAMCKGCGWEHEFSDMSAAMTGIEVHEDLYNGHDAVIPDDSAPQLDN